MELFGNPAIYFPESVKRYIRFAAHIIYAIDNDSYHSYRVISTLGDYRFMPRSIANFPDGIEVELFVHTPWWSWIYLGLLDQPTVATVRVYRKNKGTQSRWHHRWRGVQAAVVKEAITANISINSVILQSWRSGQRLIDGGTKTCTNVSSCTKITRCTRFLRPVWAGGSTITGIGYNVLVQRSTQSVSLQCHTGNPQSLPESHICK